jgi:hypothetical protein
MKSITQNKLARRLFLLFLLVGTLTYLRAPTKAHADERSTCILACEKADAECPEKCGGDPSCLALCRSEYEGCVAYCDTLP